MIVSLISETAIWSRRDRELIMVAAIIGLSVSLMIALAQSAYMIGFMDGSSHPKEGEMPSTRGSIKSTARERTDEKMAED